ncbi:MAG: CRTAC1 family protein [Planctomycetota bacterium]
MTPFTEEASPRGIAYVTPFTQAAGTGVGFMDLDDDGDPDLVAVGRIDGLIGIWENDGTGHFTDRSSTSGAPNIINGSGVSAADYDRDGDLDLYITGYLAGNHLLRNDGNFTFTDVTISAGVQDTESSFGSGWADYDLDGWVDLYVANRPVENRLFRNLGDGTFEDVAPALGVDRGDDPSFQGTFFDYDRDGDADLYIANDKGYSCATTDWRNRLFENTGRGFVDVTESMNVGACIAAMCIAIGDIDGNGYPDVYCTNLPFGNVLQLNRGAGVPFEDAAASWGVVANELGWGSAFFDVDNDTAIDLYVCHATTTNYLYRNHGYDCVELASDMGVDDGGKSFVIATADVDNDGDVDFLLQNEGQKLKLMINNEGSQRHWAKFDVVGEGPNRYAIGATVEATVGSTSMIRQVIAGHHYKSQSDLVQHFGLGSRATVIDRVDIMWPGGMTRTITGLAPNETWRLYPPDKLGDANHDGDRDIDDVVALILAFNPEPGSLRPGEEMLDFNGNAMVDADDLQALLDHVDLLP